MTITLMTVAEATSRSTSRRPADDQQTTTQKLLKLLKLLKEVTPKLSQYQ
jgi:hypothetical protein